MGLHMIDAIQKNVGAFREIALVSRPDPILIGLSTVGV